MGKHTPIHQDRIFDYSRYLDPSLLDYLEDRDFSCLLLPRIDYDSQLRAIRELLKQNKAAKGALSREIDMIEAIARKARGPANEQAVDEWIDHLRQHTFQSAAHSMAAIGMLGPFVESVFCSSFETLKQSFLNDTGALPSHPRWQRATGKEWDCHYYWEKNGRKKNLAKGIVQLSEATGMLDKLPAGLPDMLTALFLYRNNMFHNGFEWPTKKRSAFLRTAKQWPKDWFENSSTDGEPWIIYMSEGFIEKWLSTIDEILAAIGEMIRDVYYF